MLLLVTILMTMKTMIAKIDGIIVTTVAASTNENDVLTFCLQRFRP